MASSLLPDYEVKVLMKPSEVLVPNNKLRNEVLSEFSMPSSTKKMSIQFMDTKDRDIYTNGWNLRIRKTEGDKDFELTYKKRYPIVDGLSSTAEGRIAAALETAEQTGFVSTATYQAQVEVGYEKQTLSISHDEEAPGPGAEAMELPSEEDSLRFLAIKAPEEFKNWGADHLAKSIIYGPVFAKRSKGTWGDFRLFIEVWPVRKSKTDASLEPIVEVSFKTPDLKQALEGRDKLVELLREKGWFLDKEILRTKLIMERYGETTSRL